MTIIEVEFFQKSRYFASGFDPDQCFAGFYWLSFKKRVENKESYLSNTPHELAEEFPEHVDAIRSLGQEDAHFARLSDEYHTLNRSIHRAETNIEPLEDLYLVEMRKQRMALKDEIYRILTTNSAK